MVSRSFPCSLQPLQEIETGDYEEQKLELTLKALGIPDPFEQQTQLPSDIIDALRWQAARSLEEVVGEREVIM